MTLLLVLKAKFRSRRAYIGEKKSVRNAMSVSQKLLPKKTRHSNPPARKVDRLTRKTKSLLEKKNATHLRKRLRRSLPNNKERKTPLINPLMLSKTKSMENLSSRIKTMPLVTRDASRHPRSLALIVVRIFWPVRNYLRPIVFTSLVLHRYSGS